MRSYITTMLWAGLVTGLSAFGDFAVIGPPTWWRRLAILLVLPSYPGSIVVAFMGIGHGPDGFPNEEDVAPYVFTFVLWWGLIHFTRKWRARRRVAISQPG